MFQATGRASYTWVAIDKSPSFVRHGTTAEAGGSLAAAKPKISLKNQRLMAHDGERPSRHGSRKSWKAWSRLPSALAFQKTQEKHQLAQGSQLQNGPCGTSAAEGMQAMLQLALRRAVRPRALVCFLEGLLHPQSPSLFNPKRSSSNKALCPKLLNPQAVALKQPSIMKNAPVL